ncbi:MAG: DUF1489 domain-containing protein [Rhodobacteraceae bacterium]|nr:DUF1489 domain-containing protein [Paracoccaceae bacterium]
MADHIHLVKLCVGAESVEDLARWQESQRPRWPEGRALHLTRMWPKRQGELLAGGSLYWVIKGLVLCRQRLLGLEERRGADGIRRCALLLDPAILRTEPVPRAAFQGWRYLAPGDAPRDLLAGRPREEALPPRLAAALAEIGLR